jgi:opacity protein-like surface antigen
VLLEPEDFPPPPPRPRHRFDRWGFGVHAFGALLGSNRHMPSDASMGGLGLTLRYRAMPEFGFEATGEFGFGTDYNGHERDEAALLLNAVGFLNPRSPVRVYAIGGLGLSSAHVVYQTPVVFAASGASSVADGDDHFSYVGFDAGAGVEIELSPHSALHADLLGFVRDRTDSGRNSAPEFVDPATGRTTNSSGGGLLRVGAMFPW